MAVKSSWSAGDVLTAADLTDTFADKNNNKNLLYNGAMQVAQRGTSTASITTAGYYTADRWTIYLATLGTWTQSVESDGPAVSGFAKSLKMLCTAADVSPAAGDALLVEQKIEGQDLQRIKKGTASAEQLTLSFWVKSNVTGTYIAELRDAANARNVSAAYTINASATWERKTITFPADTTGALANDNTTGLELNFWLGSGSTFSSGTLGTTWHTTTANRAVGQTNLAAATNNYWQITGVQLEVGPVATGFEFKSYGQELRECQRYYYLHASGNTQDICTGAMLASNVANGFVKFPTTMRIAPTLVVTTGTNYYNFYRNAADDYCNSLTIDAAQPNGAGVRNSTEISGTAGHAGEFYTANAAASLAFNAEL